MPFSHAAADVGLSHEQSQGQSATSDKREQSQARLPTSDKSWQGKLRRAFSSDPKDDATAGDVDASASSVAAESNDPYLTMDPDECDPGQSLKKAISGIAADKQDEDPEKNLFIVGSLPFQLTVNLMTLLNTVTMGLEADHPEWTQIWFICENVFTAGFAVEMVIKLGVLKKQYFLDRANWLDGSLTLLGILDCWVFALIGGGADLQSLSVLRILRLMRLARILKLVRNFKPFVLVIQGVIEAISTTCYVFALLLLILYVFAIFVTEHLGRQAGEAGIYPGYSEESPVIDEQEIMANYNPHTCFGTMFFSMLTLFNMAMMAEWTEIVRPVSIKQPMYVPVFIVFALLVAFSVMNVMIGSIVDSVFSESKRIDEAFKEEVKKKKLDALEKTQKLLLDMDTNRDERIDLKELQDAMNENTELNLVLADIKLPVGWQANELLDMLDSSGDGLLQKAEFTTSFFRLMDSDAFQQICIMQASINQCKQLIRDRHTIVHNALLGIQSELTGLKLSMAETEEELLRLDSACTLKQRAPQLDAPRQLPEQDCRSPDDKSTIATEVKNDAPEQCSDAVCKDLAKRLQHRPPEQLTDILDESYRAMKSFFTKELEKLSHCTSSEQDCSTIVDQAEAKLVSSAEECSDMPLRKSQTNPEHRCVFANGNSLIEGSGVVDSIAKDSASYQLLQSETLAERACEVTCASVSREIDTSMPQLETLACLHEGISVHVAGKDRPAEPRFVQPKMLNALDAGQDSDRNALDHERPGCAKPTVSLDLSFEATPSIPSHVSISSNRRSQSKVLDIPSHLSGGALGIDRSSTGSPDNFLDAKSENGHSQAGDAGSSEACADDLSYEFVFEPAVMRLGFEICWLVEELPMVGRIMPDGAASKAGMQSADRLTECNGVSLISKDREDVKELLKERPLRIRALRKPI